MFRKIIGFIKNVRIEMGTVTWPSKADLKEGTTVVIIMSAIVAIFLSLVDTVFSFIIKNLFLKV